jgi:TM2 domain-containing membrane protein YozV
MKTHIRDEVPQNGALDFNRERRDLLIALSGVSLPLLVSSRPAGAATSASTSLPQSTPVASLDTPSTVTFNSTATPGLETQYAYLNSAAKPNPVFSFYGTANSLVTQCGPAYPRQNMVSADLSNSDTLSPATIYASFYHTGTTLDIIQYGLSDNVTVYIDDSFVARYGGLLVGGTAQGGMATDITLAASSSQVSGYYNEYYVRITGGTGVLNEVRQITSYSGSTFVATVSSPWTTAPDSTTQYEIQDGTQPFVLDRSTGSIKYLHLVWGQSAQRKITIEQGIFAGVASDGTIAPAPPASTTPLLVVGDSFWEGQAGPISIPRLIDTFAQSMDWLPTNLGQGGTGYIGRYQFGNRLNFQDRIAPPKEAWRVMNTATSGTYTISVTLNGVTSTTAALLYNTSQTSVETALNALANVAAVSGYFYVARGDYATPRIYVGHGIGGATIAFNNTWLVGGTISVVGNYIGDVAPNVPLDTTGQALPFYLLVAGSGNDAAYTDSQVQAAATYVAQQIVQRFPTAKAIFTGVIGDCAATSTGVIGASDLSRNAAIAAGAALLAPMGTKSPFVDTYANGLGGNKIIYGLGTVANPTLGTNSNFKSITVPSHPTGPGSRFFSDWLATQVTGLIAPPAPPLDLTPTVTSDSTATAGLVTQKAFLTNGSKLNPAYSFYGVAASLVSQFGPAYPRQNMVSADLSNSDTSSPGVIYASFYHTGKTLDIIQYGFSDSVTLYINDTFSARYGGALVSGTAQGGSASGITLASTSSAVSGYYNEYYVRIAGGRGVLNEVRQITSYSGSTLVATVSSPWTTAPDTTTQYVIQDGTQPFVLDRSTGSIRYLHFAWKQSGQRKITIEQGIFAGAASDGSITPAPPWSTIPLLVVGDSFWEGEAAPVNIPRLTDTFAQSMGWLPTNLGQGGTGYVNRDQAGSRLNFQDRIAPPNESWRVMNTATGGTYTISVTLNGVTSTTAALPYNASQASVESALNSLSNVAAVSGYFYVARGDFATPRIYVGHGIKGATIAFITALTGGTIGVLGNYTGDVAPNVPTDTTGKALPFYLLVAGSGNDWAYTDAQVKAAATYVA